MLDQKVSSLPVVSGVILAGGMSLRMGGSPKALLPIGERTIIGGIIEIVGSVLPDLMIITNAPETYAFLGVPMVGDVYPGGGPLGGIYSGLRAVSGDYGFVFACDMPFLSRDLIQYMLTLTGEADVIIPRLNEHLEALHAIYSKRCLMAMRSKVEAGRLKVTGFFPQVRVRELGPEEVARFADPEVCFMNVNTPEELDRGRRLIGG